MSNKKKNCLPEAKSWALARDLGDAKDSKVSKDGGQVVGGPLEAHEREAKTADSSCRKKRENVSAKYKQKLNERNSGTML